MSDLPVALQVAALFGVFVGSVLLGYTLVWLYGLIFRPKDDDFRPIGDEAPPPPHVSPFASPRTHGELTPAEGEVKP